MNYYIVTGASRGIGEALARKLATKGNTVFTVSRYPLPDLEAYFRELAVDHRHFTVDLSDIASLPGHAREIFAKIPRDEASQLTLINNAAVLEPVSPCGTEAAGEVNTHMQVNLIAPILLSSTFIRQSQDWAIPKAILNISSGAGRNPYAGWSSYCTSKAGLDMFTRCVALEQEKEPHPVRMIAIGPGVVDTAMQGILRKKTAREFPMHERFMRLKEDGKLTSPKRAASLLLKALEEAPAGTVSDLREMY